MRLVMRPVKVPLRQKQIEERVAVVIQPIESGIESDKRVMGEEAHAVWRLKEQYGWTQKEY